MNTQLIIADWQNSPLFTTWFTSLNHANRITTRILCQHNRFSDCPVLFRTILNHKRTKGQKGIRILVISRSPLSRSLSTSKGCFGRRWVLFLFVSASKFGNGEKFAGVTTSTTFDPRGGCNYLSFTVTIAAPRSPQALLRDRSTRFTPSPGHPSFRHLPQPAQFPAVLSITPVNWAFLLMSELCYCLNNNRTELFLFGVNINEGSGR
ncbi:hypothetical protein GWI33_002384 [Rhynchophorus ferrugineus]|uniref:Uncharacterized protein n=1 Tax=Rhynchophorus ferrugineus TaxID=354439 RepID=A0A834IKE3_RHYFE|nr:hypothetical protein GWI33_002384 [Rhynchophorus ferrugineus]